MQGLSATAIIFFILGIYLKDTTHVGNMPFLGLGEESHSPNDFYTFYLAMENITSVRYGNGLSWWLGW